MREEMTMFGVGGGARGTDVRALVRKGDGERGVGERWGGYIWEVLRCFGKYNSKQSLH